MIAALATILGFQLIGEVSSRALNLPLPGPVVGLVLLVGCCLVWPALAYNAAAGLALAFGVAVRPVALSLALYCAVTSVFHFLPEDPWQMTIFVKNWAIAGGCLALAVAGAGRISVRLA